MEEQWKPVKGFENYQISNFGRVQSFSRKHRNGLILKPKVDRYGYETVCIGNLEGRKCPTIHRLVAMAFIDNPENKATVNHKDGIKANNIVDNLEWLTATENVQHSFATGLRNYSEDDKWKMHLSKTRKVDQFDLDNNLIKTWDCIKHIMESMNTQYARIIDVCKGRKQNYRGFIWKYHIPSSAISNSLGV